MNQENIIKILTVIAVLCLVALFGYSAFVVFYQAPSKENIVATEATSLEENAALKATIDTLETMWKDRQHAYFSVGQDPLHPGRVIKDFKYAKAQGEADKEEYEIRLSATVIDENPKAIIRYNGKSYVVQAGDLIGTSYRVLKIEKMQVVLDNKGKRIVLETKPAAGSENKIEESEYSNTKDFNGYNY